MSDRDNTDLWTAVTIGAVVGIGAALLLRARQSDDDLKDVVIKRLAPARKRGRRAMRSAKRTVSRGAEQAADAGEELLRAGRDVLNELRTGARDIVQSTRDELEKVARDSLADARKAARRTFR